jgi:hypothetical protein
VFASQVSRAKRCLQIFWLICGIASLPENCRTRALVLAPSPFRLSLSPCSRASMPRRSSPVPTLSSHAPTPSTRTSHESSHWRSSHLQAHCPRRGVALPPQAAMDAAFELRSSYQGLHPLPSYPSCSGEGSGVGYDVGASKRVQVGRGGTPAW